MWVSHVFCIASLNQSDEPAERSLSKSGTTHWHPRPYQWPSSGLAGPQHTRLASICRDLKYWTAQSRIRRNSSTYFLFRWIYHRRLLNQKQYGIGTKSLGSNSRICLLTLTKDMSWKAQSAPFSYFWAKPWQTPLSRSTLFQNRL